MRSLIAFAASLLTIACTGPAQVAEQPQAQPRADIVLRTAAMPGCGRFDGRVVPMRDGSALLVGGEEFVGGQWVPTNQILRFDGHVWSLAGELAIVRDAPAAVQLQDGRVLVVGGSASPSTTEVFDPVTTICAPGPTLSYQYSSGSGGAILQPDGRVLIAGGMTGRDERGAELVDVAGGTVMRLPAMPGDVFDVEPVALGGGDALYLGEPSVGGRPLPWLWHAATHSYEALTQPAYNHGIEAQLVGAAGSAAYLGGADAPAVGEVVDLASKKWTGPALPASEALAAASGRTDGRILMATRAGVIYSLDIGETKKLATLGSLRLTQRNTIRMADGRWMISTFETTYMVED